jgi:hypothetical protein
VTRFSSAAFVAALCSCLCAPRPAFSDTEVCGTLSLAAEWTAAQSPYVVTGDIFIPQTSRLRIGPGVTVRFEKPRPCESEKVLSKEHAKGHAEPIPQVDWADSAYTGIKIEGTFFCIGTEDKPIVFEPAPPKAGAAPARSAVGWDGIRLSGLTADQVEIAFAEFRGANQAVTAEKSGFYVHHCLFEGNNTGLYLGLRGDLAVINCAFIGNLSAGIVIRKGGPRITGTIFSGNHGYGIWGDGRNTARITNNDFWNSGEEHCYRCPYPVLAAEAEAKGKKEKEKAGGAERDPLGNMAVNPVFLGTPDYQAARAADLKTPTPVHLVKDPELAKLEAEARAKSEKSGKAAQAAADFEPQGKGPYVLSEYSPLIDAGPPGRDFRDRDGSRNDIGLHGGTLGRITRDPF